MINLDYVYRYVLEIKIMLQLLQLKIIIKC